MLLFLFARFERGVAFVANLFARVTRFYVLMYSGQSEKTFAAGVASVLAEVRLGVSAQGAEIGECFLTDGARPLTV